MPLSGRGISALNLANPSQSLPMIRRADAFFLATIESQYVPMSVDLSTKAKQTIQIAGLIATVLVVGIHYKSDVPLTTNWTDANWNQLSQELLFGGIARVAVPVFALIAGLLYFRSDDGTWKCYVAKLSGRMRTIALPYFLVASIATLCWLISQWLKSDPDPIGTNDLFLTWLLRPPAEQLWFLRDLMVLVFIAPAIRFLVSSQPKATIVLSAMFVAWILHYEWAPIVAGWYLLQIETLAFFTLGCALSKHLSWVNRLVQVSRGTCATLVAAWLTLTALRIVIRADFDLWYTRQYGMADLMVYKASILVGCLALVALAAQLNTSRLRHWAGASFFVFLVHEFPLRAIVNALANRVVDSSIACWVTTPCVVAACYATGIYASKWYPTLFGILTGGRMPSRHVHENTSAHNQVNAARPQREAVS